MRWPVNFPRDVWAKVLQPASVYVHQSINVIIVKVPSVTLDIRQRIVIIICSKVTLLYMTKHRIDFWSHLSNLAHMLVTIRTSDDTHRTCPSDFSHLIYLFIQYLFNIPILIPCTGKIFPYPRKVLWERIINSFFLFVFLFDSLRPSQQLWSCLLCKLTLYILLKQLEAHNFPVINVSGGSKWGLPVPTPCPPFLNILWKWNNLV